MTTHRIPALDRAMEILDALATAAPSSIRDLAGRCGLARSTVYRTLNTLEAHGLVKRVEEGSYVLGHQILRLARAVPQGMDLSALARPVLDRLAASLGASAKLSIVDADEALVVATAEAPGVYSITTQIGRRFPLHAGAASKLLLAYLPEARQRSVLAQRLPAFTPRTITNPGQLKAQLGLIRSQGWSEDSGEYAEGVHAIAAPVFDAFDDLAAAVSVPFVSVADAGRFVRVRDEVVEAGREISRLLGAGAPQSSSRDGHD
jgi:DNA-binding IclR family transcriptional regulator